MKLILVLFLLLTPLSELNKIAKINAHKKEAKEAYLAEDFEKAAHHYRFLVDSLGVMEDEVLLNLANSLYKIQDTTSAKNLYTDVLSNSSSREIKSMAYQQLGTIDFSLKKYEEALNHYKNALKQYPGNEDARYNYELLKKILEEQEEKNQEQQQQNQENQENKDEQSQDKKNKDQQNQDQENKDQENQEQQNQENQENQQQQDERQEGEEQQQQDEREKQKKEKSEEGEENEENPEDRQPTTAEKLDEMNISEEKARMILEAMKNNEIQYIQQNKRKAKKPKKSGKPDW